MSDESAFLEATMPHLDLVHRVARGLMVDPREAEDLVQETYLRAFAKFSTHHGPNTRAWLIAICVNAARSQFRRATRRPLEVRADLPELVDDRVDVVEEVVAVLDREALTEALSRLPEAQRTVLVLMDIGGLTAAEVSTALGCPRGTVLARAHRGRKHLVRLFLAERELR